ncbi:MAG: 4-oxalocrotonate tautomerase family enzyme [Tissierellia bacterium]|nr:4-oxalocrotonate tautomerase family enzyme [Tissierellia bacterium]
MPHIRVKMFPGRTEEIKQSLADALKKTMIEELQCPEGVVSVSIVDVEKDKWDAEVMDKIQAEEMFIKPNK